MSFRMVCFRDGVRGYVDVLSRHRFGGKRVSKQQMEDVRMRCLSIRKSGRVCQGGTEKKKKKKKSDFKLVNSFPLRVIHGY